MNFEKYAAFTLQDFLADDSFIDWVQNPGEESDAFWISFTENNPRKKELMEKAAAVIRQYRTQDTFDNNAHKDLLWKRIEASIGVTAANKPAKILGLPVFTLLRAAAVVLVVAGLSIWLIGRYNTPKEYSYTTAFGEVKTIELPDHSQVTLNGNSSVSYPADWSAKKTREVWIKGEGYFNVTHLNKDSNSIKPGETFVVHCGDVNIEVLGTTFNVKARHGKTNVALITGKIRIDYTDPAAASKAIVLVPGDYVEYTASKLVATKKLVKPASITTWRAKEISFTDATLREITETLQDNYGYSIDVKDPALMSLKIEGDISVSGIADLLDVVGTTLNITIEQSSDKHITITK